MSRIFVEQTPPKQFPCPRFSERSTKGRYGRAKLVQMSERGGKFREGTNPCWLEPCLLTPTRRRSGLGRKKISEFRCRLLKVRRKDWRGGPLRVPVSLRLEIRQNCR